MMDDISNEDKLFLDDFFADELTDKNLKELDRRLKSPNFKQYYNQRLDQKYTTSPTRLFMDYLPMILFIGLTIIGIYLIWKKMK